MALKLECERASRVSSPKVGPKLYRPVKDWAARLEGGLEGERRELTEGRPGAGNCDDLVYRGGGSGCYRVALLVRRGTCGLSGRVGR